jgi:spermidine synthase
MIDEVKLRLRKRHLPASQRACDHSHDATTRDHRRYHRLLDHPRPHRSGTAEKTRVVVVAGACCGWLWLRVLVVAVGSWSAGR